MSLLLAAGGAGSPVNYVLTCAAGSYAYTGTDASLKVEHSLVCDAGAYTYTGVAASLDVAHSLVCDAGAYAYTGNAATLTYVPGAGAVNYTLICDAGTYSYSGNDATLTYAVGAVTGHSGGDDAWRKEKKKKKKDLYAEQTVARKEAVIAAYKGLLEPETPETVAIEAKTVVQSEELDALDLAKVQKLLALWQAELDRREEQDDEEALLMLL